MLFNKTKLNSIIKLLQKSSKASLKSILEVLGNDYTKEQAIILKNIINTIILHYQFSKNGNKKILITRDNFLNSNSEILIGVQILAVIDKSTSDLCRLLNLIMIKKSDANNLNILKPPHEIGCKCIYSPVTIYEKNTKFINKINGYEKLINLSGNSYLELTEDYLNKYGLLELKSKEKPNIL